MQKLEPLVNGNYYHIYNRGINSCNLFEENSNYEYFLWLYENHITPVAETYAWVLMKNHFHFLVRIKAVEEIVIHPVIKNHTDLHLTMPHQYFSNLFNAYSKAFNKRYKRHGSLFERPFKRKIITDINYLKQVVNYIHNNPLHHGFTENLTEYPWSSYLECYPKKLITIQSKNVKKWLEDDTGYQKINLTDTDIFEIEKWLEI